MTPEIAVIIPSHDRPVRLRWLLNALEEQTLEPDRWEVVVGHDSRGPETEELLRTHPLATAGRLRHVRLPPGTAPPGANRNAAWRLTDAPVIAFTDDDCRPPAEWLERALAAARAYGPQAIVQGTTRPDPDELSVALHAPHARSQTIDPPVPWAQACNIVYARAQLEAAGGFDETMYGGEDAELAQRVVALGGRLVGEPEVLTYHAVSAPGLLGAVRSVGRWGDLAELVRRHPGLRRHFPLRIFWRDTHPLFLIGLAGLAGATVSRRRAPVLLALPWAWRAAPRYGPSKRGRLRAASELPGRAVVEAAEIIALARGSVRRRSLLL